MFTKNVSERFDYKGEWVYVQLINHLKEDYLRTSAMALSCYVMMNIIPECKYLLYM